MIDVGTDKNVEQLQMDASRLSNTPPDASRSKNDVARLGHHHRIAIHRQPFPGMSLVKGRGRWARRSVGKGNAEEGPEENPGCLAQGASFASKLLEA